MNHKLIYLVSGMQRFTVGSLSPKLVYELYLKTLPKGYLELNYIKGNSEIKYSDKLITFFAEQFKESKRNIIDWIELTSTDHLLNKLNIKDIHELEEVYKIK